MIYIFIELKLNIDICFIRELDTICTSNQNNLNFLVSFLNETEP